jgi:hypothetical protein
MVKRKFQISTTDYDLSVFDKTAINILGSPKHEIARDIFGNQLLNVINEAIEKEKYRLEPIEEYHGINVETVTYATGEYPFTHASGLKYKVGHIYFHLSQYGKESVVDIIPLPRKEVPIVYGELNFLSLDDIEKELKFLIDNIPEQAEKYQSRLDKIEAARKKGGLSCNYYRHLLTHEQANNEDVEEADTELRACVKNTIFGIIDPLYPRLLRMIPKRFIINREDILNQYRYIYSLDESARGIIKDYTNTTSGPWNLTLFHNALYPNEAVPEDPRIQRLQKIIMSVPPLEFDIQVYRINRYFFFKDVSNQNLKINTVQYQATFLSTTYDNELNVSPFIDLFSICCAYVIRIPKGSRVLVIGETAIAKYSTEYEVLLPIGSGLRIDDKAVHLVTSSPGAVFYNETTTYKCTYIDPAEMKKLKFDKAECLGNDCVPHQNVNSKLWSKVHNYQK